MDFLGPGEKVHMSFRTSRRYSSLLKYFFFAIILFILALLFFIGYINVVSAVGRYLPGVPIQEGFAGALTFIGLVLVGAGEMKRIGIGKYYITNYRIVATRGILGSKTDSVSYQMIVNVKISQTFLERIFGLGNIEVFTARGKQEIYMLGITNTKKAENIIYKFLEAHSKGYDQSTAASLAGVQTAKKTKS